MRIQEIDFTFTDGLSEKKTLDTFSIIGLVTPASLGASTISFRAAKTPDQDFLDVYSGCDNEIITIDVDPTEARHYDLSDDFPASIKAVQIVATGVTNGKTIILLGKNT